MQTPKCKVSSMINFQDKGKFEDGCNIYRFLIQILRQAKKSYAEEKIGYEVRTKIQ